jgi:predicted transcriptional regulator
VPEQTSANYVELAADVVSAYVSNNPVPTSELPSLIAAVHASLQFVAEGPKEQPKEPLVPAVSIKKSVQPDYIVCLEDGKKFQSLKRHLRKFDMTPDQYRAKWDLPRDYPMVAPNYASRRSELAKAIGLGQERKGKSSKKKAAA